MVKNLRPLFLRSKDIANCLIISIVLDVRTPTLDLLSQTQIILG